MVIYRVAMTSLSDTDKEKIALDIKSITDYEQEYLNSKSTGSVREIEMTLDEWKTLVASLPNKELNVYINEGRLYGTGNDPLIVKGNGKVFLRHDSPINETKVKHMLAVLPDARYELFTEPVKSAPTNEAKQSAPEPTAEEKRNANLTLRMEEQLDRIVSCREAIKLARELSLNNQVTLYESKLQYHEACMKHISSARYNANDRGSYRVSAPGELKQTLIPLDALKVIKEQQANFDSIEVWIESDDDPLLIGVTENDYHNIYVELASW